MSEAAMQVRFAENVRRLREGTGMSQEELSRRAGLQRTHVNIIESGRRAPRLDTLLKLIGALGTSPNEILDGLAWEPPPTEEKGGWVLAPVQKCPPGAEGGRT